MKPLNRTQPSKRGSISSFNRKAQRTKAANTSQPMRGGWRL